MCIELSCGLKVVLSNVERLVIRLRIELVAREHDAIISRMQSPIQIVVLYQQMFDGTNGGLRDIECSAPDKTEIFCSKIFSGSLVAMSSICLIRSFVT